MSSMMGQSLARQAQAALMVPGGGYTAPSPLATTDWRTQPQQWRHMSSAQQLPSAGGATQIVASSAAAQWDGWSSGAAATGSPPVPPVPIRPLQPLSSPQMLQRLGSPMQLSTPRFVSPGAAPSSPGVPPRGTPQPYAVDAGYAVMSPGVPMGQGFYSPLAAAASRQLMVGSTSSGMLPLPAPSNAGGSLVVSPGLSAATPALAEPVAFAPTPAPPPTQDVASLNAALLRRDQQIQELEARLNRSDAHLAELSRQNAMLQHGAKVASSPLPAPPSYVVSQPAQVTEAPATPAQRPPPVSARGVANGPMNSDRGPLKSPRSTGRSAAAATPRDAEDGPQSPLAIEDPDEIDERIQEYLRGHPEFTVTMEKLKKGWYVFGKPIGKKVYIKQVSGKTVVRIGGGYKNLEKFFDEYTLPKGKI